ncbi:hypothetical protein F5050DRAFT_1716396, partial [Lentinula boryana]
MPKSSVKRENRSTSKEQSTLLNRCIDAQLRYLQKSLGYPLNPRKPTTLVQGEYASRWNIFIGASSKGAVTGPDHCNFPKLGRLYCTVHTCTMKVFKQMEWNSHSIPCVVLETNKDLMDSLAMREVLASRLTHKFGQSTTRSSSPSVSLDFSGTSSSSHATTSSPLVYSTCTTAPSTSLSISADAHSISDSDDDFEMSEPFVPDFASPKHISRLASSPSLRSSLNDSEEEIVTNNNSKFFTLSLVVWTKHYDHVVAYNVTLVSMNHVCNDVKLLAPRQIMSSLSRSGLSTTTRIIGAPSVQQETGSAIPAEPTATTSLYAEESMLELDFVEESRTQRAKLLAEYQEFLPTAAKLLMMQEADSRIGQLCSCGHAARRVRCQQCLQQAPLCHSCWLGAHKHQPLHWAEAWDETEGYFVRHDISMLMPESLGIPLGHDGNQCPYATTPLLMTLVDVGGVHATRVTFCGCPDHLSKWHQLFHAGLLPATVKDPQSAFTLNLLRQWDLFNLQSKITAIWPWIQMEKRFGGLYGDGMTECFPHRPKDNVMNFCPVCPDADVNMEDGWECAPSHLCHIHSSHITIDGNMKTGNYTKRNDPNDMSLFDGRAYMANSKRYEHYLKTVPQLQNEKVTCNHLNVANGASRSKFKNLRVIGTVNVHCDHYMVGSSVDIIGAERFATIDFALELFHEARPFKGKQPDKLISYDYACGLTPNISDRFHQYHPTQAPIIDNARWIIPSCHVCNHIEGCDYLYSYLYKSSTGHFYGESAEAPWDIFNQLGSSVMQMSAGHRIDTLISHYNDWNWRKTVGIVRQVLKDLDYAKVQYVQKRDHFLGLCLMFEDKVCEWTQLDHSPIIDPHNKKRVLSVYSHGDNKAPSLKSLVDKLMSSEETVPMSFGKVKLAGPVYVVLGNEQMGQPVKTVPVRFRRVLE